eukprot:Blabericola_migrator_1__5948@NODE_2_length_32877_cov_165_790003_g1_i0_p17_GENE_NODE_2_length_32877_cov_165_790003_g1_i0NODE_2_length_32877_cov_165_790003_g1_i0_p17_ORF_typecomplete_len218_score24_74Clat_adaptor_s/PF01217_20/1_1e23AP5_subunit_s1/PF15001_6/0_12DUF924/PF06041_11/0_26_NODE_2_length_32877_cov_165_790003_g1_i02342224075
MVCADELDLSGITGDAGLSQILAIIILNDRGQRVITRYSPSALQHAVFATHAAQVQFEEQLLDKTQKQNCRSGQVEVVIHEEYLTLYRNVNDLHFIVIGDPNENEILLLDVINALYNALSQVTDNRLTYDALICSLDMALLAVDEMIEGSLIFEVDPVLIVSRAKMEDLPSTNPLASAAHGGRSVLNSAMGDGTAFNTALNAAKEGILKGFFGAISA